MEISKAKIKNSDVIDTLVADTIYLEAESCSFTEQVLVGVTIYNRIAHPEYFPGDPIEMIMKDYSGWHRDVHLGNPIEHKAVVQAIEAMLTAKKYASSKKNRNSTFYCTKEFLQRKGALRLSGYLDLDKVKEIFGISVNLELAYQKEDQADFCHYFFRIVPKEKSK